MYPLLLKAPIKDNIWGKEALGKNAERFTYFPLLIKLIDAKDKLSVQVHPDDAYALKNEGEYGKTEMWYVVDCDEGSSLIYGFNREISKEEFASRIKDNTLGEVCNYVPVKKGDVFFKVKLINLSGKTEICEEDSFVSLLVLSGEVALDYNGAIINAKKGYSIFIPANMKTNLSGEGQVLLSRV